MVAGRTWIRALTAGLVTVSAMALVPLPESVPARAPAGDRVESPSAQVARAPARGPNPAGGTQRGASPTDGDFAESGLALDPRSTGAGGPLAQADAVVRGVRYYTVDVVGIDVPGASFRSAAVTPRFVANRFAEVTEYFRRATGGRIVLRLGNFLPWRTAAVTACDFWAVKGTADARLRAAGRRPNLYLAVTDTRCAGLAGKSMNAAAGSVSFGWEVSDVWAHELGHGLGLGHSTSLRCPTGPLSWCSDPQARPEFTEYDDEDDIMGPQGASTAMDYGLLNPVHAARLGALPEQGQVVLKQRPVRPVTVRLQPWDGVPSNDPRDGRLPRAISMRWGVTPVWITYDGRDDYPYDAQVPGVRVHFGYRNRSGILSSAMTHPRALAPGGFYRGNLGVAMKVESVGPRSALVTVFPTR